MRFTSHQTLIARAIAAAAMFASAAALAVPESAQTTVESALARLTSNANGQLQIATALPEAYTLLRAKGGNVLLADNNAAQPVERAFNFLSLNGIALGIKQPLAELLVKRVSKDAEGNQHVHMEQTHNGLPVFGTRVVVHLNNKGVYGVNGAFIKELDALPTTPGVSEERMKSNALRAVQKLNPQTPLYVERSRLMYYRSGMLEGFQGRNYLAYEVVINGLTDTSVREILILNAADGTLINRIAGVHTQLNREIHTPNIKTPPLLTEGSALAPADIPLSGEGPSDPLSRAPRLPTHNLYLFAGGTYELYKNLFGREGYNDGAIPAEEQVQKSVYLVNQQCPNAYWDGTSTNYCPAFDADDVVSHEWSHAYTEYTHGLIYQYQSGALNESYSDIFGETYDLVNGIEGPLGITLTEGKYFEEGGSRWVVGEDLTAVAAGLLLRDMWDPDNFGINVPLLNIPILPTPSPGSVITSPNYYCATGDGGGVHTNSGVPNHAFAMLVDGKEFNGVTVPGIGLIKAAHIYFQASSHYQTPTTNFAQHADALEQSCTDLLGAPLNGFDGQVSDQVIEPKDCEAVAAAMLAVEMRDRPHEKCGYVPVLSPEAETPAICGEGKSEVADYAETWEDADALPAGWATSMNLAGDTPSEQWHVTSELPLPHTGNAVFFANSTGGTCTAGGDLSGAYQLDSPEVEVKDDASFFKFTHLMQSEAGFDGGNLKFSVNGGEFAIVPQEAFRHNAHSSVFTDSGTNTSPLAGQQAWSGSDQGESFSTWGTTIVDLAALGAKTGDKVKFRFDFGQDGCNGNLGWFVDDVSVLHCGAGPAKSNPARFGGAFGLFALLPLLGLALLRRRRA